MGACCSLRCLGKKNWIHWSRILGACQDGSSWKLPRSHYCVWI